MVALRKPRGAMETFDAQILADCFYSDISCEMKAKDVRNKCEESHPAAECKKMEETALRRYCSRPMRANETFCEVFHTTKTTTTTSTTTTTTTTLRPTTSKNPLLKTQYVISYGAIGGVIGVLLMAVLICWICEKRSEKKKKKADEEWKNVMGWAGSGTTSEGSATKSDVEKGTTGKKTKTKTKKSTGKSTLSTGTKSMKN